MDLEKVLLLVVLALFIALLIIEFLKKDIRIETGLISKQSLLDLLNDKPFKKLYLNSFSNASFIKRDKIRLESHIELLDEKLPFQKKKLLEKSKEKGFVTNKEISYSIYRLGKTEIQKILDFFPGQEVGYFILEGVDYKDNNSNHFIAYKIFPANYSKQRLILDWSTSRSFNQMTGDVKRDSTDDSLYVEGQNYLLLKPSPPASSSID